MNFEEVRILTITALFSDDIFFDQLVLKGGNAMSLVHRIGDRFSLDVDFSLEDDFQDIEETRQRMEHALVRRFETVQLKPFDIKLVPKPSVMRDEIKSWWGGYELQFKLINQALHRSYGSDRVRLGREAVVIGPDQKRIFTVDFSKHEYTQGKVRAELDAYTIYVYPPAMIALEKVRAICQQTEYYAPTGNTKRARARDFLDIYNIVTTAGFTFDSPESRELVRLIFDAKEVPLFILGNLDEQRDFHRADWPNVQATVQQDLQEFDFYFEFVLREIEPLHSLWEE